MERAESSRNLVEMLNKPHEIPDSPRTAAKVKVPPKYPNTHFFFIIYFTISIFLIFLFS